jgi:DNA invertase Pin-like site-specific DNA recombinase
MDATPTAVLIRQILGAVAQFDKAMTVSKLRGARDKKRAKYGRCEGRKSILERDPRIVEAAKMLAREKLSLRQISAALQTQGFVSEKGTPFSAARVVSMLEAKR